MNGMATKEKISEDIKKYYTILLNIRSNFVIYESLVEKIDNKIALASMNKSSAYYQFVLNSLTYYIRVRLCALLSDSKSSKNLHQLINCAKSNKKLFNNTGSVLEIDDFDVALEMIYEELEKNSAKLEMLKINRDKVLAHLDKKFFNNPDALKESANLNSEDILTLIHMSHKILLLLSFFLEGREYMLDSLDSKIKSDINNLF